MRVNLSSFVVVIEWSGLAQAMQDATSKVLTSTGVSLPISPSSDNTNDELETQIGKLLTLCHVEGPRPEAAAAVLLTLAASGRVMLPAIGPSLVANASAAYVLELPEFLERVDAAVQAERPRWLTKRSHLQLILATDCRQSDGFNIHDFARLHSWLMHKYAIDRKFSTLSPAFLLLRGIELADDTALARDLRHGYLIWRASGADEADSFEEFMSNPSNLDGARVHGHKRERVELPSETERRVARASERRGSEQATAKPSAYLEGLHKIARSKAPTAPEDYFAALRGGSNVKGFRPDGWLDQPTNYPGRETIDIARLGSKWFTAFSAFLARRRKDYETDGQVRSALAVLADYVLLYLPWWMEFHPETTLEFPDSPKKFLRYFYVDRTRFHSEEGQGLGALPKTLNEILPLRRPTPGARNGARLPMEQFFNFVLTYFEDDEEYVSKGMQNPIRTDFDNEVAGRRTKTNKVPFAEDVFPFLVHYGQALEAFGEFIQQEAYLKNRLKTLPFGPADGYDTAKWGFVPIFWYRGRVYRLEWVPNIYVVHKRLLMSNPPAPAGLYVHGHRINSGVNRSQILSFPHLTTLRLLMAMVETGLRGQSFQWLDRRTFDQLAPKLAALAHLHGRSENQGFHSLYINTDKSHDEWRNLVSWRVRRSLLAESYFQTSIADSNQSVEVPYEDRTHSRFAPVMPLFRSDRGAKPVSDGAYSKRWVEFLYGFQKFYNCKDGVDKSESDDALVVLRERDDWDEEADIFNAYSAIHTPHACRATYATLKDGDLEVAEIADQLGHSNTAVTHTYQVPQMKRLLAKLKAIDERTLSANAYELDSAGEAYLHPERQGSSVRAAFEQNREQAISDFGFVPGVALWSLSELDGDSSTLEILRQSPASVIRWHPTHVCPVGNQCPREVVANTGGLARCGMCPLATKCIDHLPAIEAKQRELLERIRTTTVRQEQLEKRKASQADIDALHRAKALDTKEFLGWKLSAEILRSRQRELGENHRGYHADQPELVRKQLELVSRSRTESEFFLQRIADSNAMPSLESPEVRAKALRYTRLILAQQGRFQEAALLDVPPHSETMVFASLVKPFVEAKGMTLEQLGAALDDVSRVGLLSNASTTLLLEER